MNDFDVSFKSTDNVYNVVSKAVLLPDAAMLDQEKIGQTLYDSFIAERINGESSVWSPMKKRKLQTFKLQPKTIRSKVGDKVIQLKEEKTLLTRFLITARKRPELDLEYCLGNFELAIIPKSLFSQDGEPLKCTDKAKVLHHIEEIESNCSVKVASYEAMEVTPSTKRVIIVDGMAVVNQVNKNKDMKICRVTIIYLF